MSSDRLALPLCPFCSHIVPDLLTHHIFPDQFHRLRSVAGFSTQPVGGSSADLITPNNEHDDSATQIRVIAITTVL
jgi:hypothetical protein